MPWKYEYEMCNDQNNMAPLSLCSHARAGFRKINKLSLVGMQLPEKYKANFGVSSEGPWSGVTSGVGKIT
jgi:hypothetical protein